MPQLTGVKPRFFVDAHLANLFSAEAEEGGAEAVQEVSQEEPTRNEHEELPIPRPLPTSLLPEEYAALTQHNEARHEWIEQEGAQDRRVTSRGYHRMADLRVSTTDPDATLMPTKDGTDMGYRTHYVVDGGRARIIVAALVTPSEVMDNQPMLDLLWRVRFRWKLWPRQVTGDRKYGTEDNIVAIEREQISAYIPSPDFDHRTGFFSPDRFHYEAERDVYLCPAGKELRFDRPHSTARSLRYRARAKECNHCPRHPRSVPRVSRDAASVAVSMRKCWIGSEAIRRPKPTKRPIANAPSGSNRYSRDQQRLAWHATLSLAAALASQL